MRSISVAQAGSPFQLIQTEIPEPTPDEAQIKIAVAGVSFADILISNGLYPAPHPFPLTPGYELVGTVESIGSEVSTLQVGQVVAALPIVGSYADKINLPAAAVVPIPTGLDSAEAVSLLANYVTAYQILHRVLNVHSGQRVLVHSAAGGVGTALLELSRLAGMETYGTASRGKHALVESLGAVPIDYKSEDFVERIRALTGDGVDIVLDPIGGAHLQQSYDALNAEGRLVAFGTLASFEAGKPPPQKLETYRESIERLNQAGDGRQALSYSFFATRTAHPDWLSEDLSILFGLLATHQLHPVIAERLPLEKAAQAHAMLQAGQTTGKLVLMCNS